MKLCFACVAFFTIVFLPACTSPEPFARSAPIEREDRFALNIGALEDQIAFFNLENTRGVSPVDIAMRDGFFYISDSNGAKILRFNSFGDLLFMIYNEETNPPPLTLNPFTEGNLLTRWAVPHPLKEPGLIAVDSRRHIYVQDRQNQDSNSRQTMDNTVLHFDGEGRFLGALGREGMNGTPFPRITGIFASIRDELAVVCLLSEGWNIYWFDSSGNFLFLIFIGNESFPLPPGRRDLIPSLDKIAVSPDSRKIFIKIDYYMSVFDELTGTESGIENDSSLIWIMDAENGAWKNHINIPFFEYTYMEQNRRQTAKTIYSFIGAANNGQAFLSFPVDGGYSILVLPSDGGQAGRHQGFIAVDNDDTKLNVFDLSGNGILSGLLAGSWHLQLVWWRTDRLL